MMRVLICRSNPIAPDPRVEKVAQALSNAGYKVQVLGWDRTGQLKEKEGLGSITIHRLPIRAQFGSGLGNLPQLLRWQAGLLIWLIRHRNEYDFIHACDFDTILPALFLKKIWGKALIYDIFDFYADHLRRTPQWIKNCIRTVDLWAIGQADAVVLADDSRREQISGSRPRDLIVIYNAPEDWQAKNLPPTREGGPFALRIAYIGLLQKERGLFELLEILAAHPEWHLDLAGFGGDQEQILALASRIKNTHWHGRVSYETALSLSAAADVLIATYDPLIPNHRFSSPNKIFEAMMLAKPVIVAKGTNMDRIVERHHCGIVIPYGDKLSLEGALQELAIDATKRQRLGANGRKAYEQEYHWNIMESRLNSLYQRVAERHAVTK